MEFANTILDIVDRAERSAPPIRADDWWDDKGLLHCGKCGESLECIIDVDRVVAHHTDIDERRRARERVARLFEGRKLRCVCKCPENDRKAYEKIKRAERIRDNRAVCFDKATRLIGYTFEADDNKYCRASELSRRYANNFTTVRQKGIGLIYYGDVGHGKTFLACAVANAVIDKGYAVKFTSLTRLFSMASQYVSIEMIADGVCENDLVVIDDLGAEELTPKTVAKTYYIVNALCERGVPFVITTNLTPEQLNAPTDVDVARVYSRILGKCTPIKVDSGIDRRFNDGKRA